LVVILNLKVDDCVHVLKAQRIAQQIGNTDAETIQLGQGIFTQRD
jgi:hypothetical protein